ncbi:aldehyde dehydrogenase family protein [Klebsiella pneumoniae subsp. pneumoniae]|nr:aldehyde dehydrogenase family protein [Klebsiella pneumoniae subsp. pneumoniae]
MKNGAKLHLGGKAVAREGNFFEPTILTGITRDNPAYFEEFFGPVAQIYVVKNDEEAIQLANDSHYGLGGAVFSQDIERAKRMASAIETGMVYINLAHRYRAGAAVWRREAFRLRSGALRSRHQRVCEPEAGGGAPLSL